MKRATTKGGATILDIATRTGLSPTTVSAVLGGRHAGLRIADKTVERVLDMARKVGYVPNLAARRLRAHHRAPHQVMLAVITSFEAPISLVSQVIRGLRRVVDAGAREGTSFMLSVEMFHAGRLRELPGLLDMSRFNGAIISNTVAADDEFLASAFIPYPAVLIGRQVQGYSSVREAPGVGKLAAEILMSAGCSRMGILYPEVLTQSTAGRRQSFMEAVERVKDMQAEVLTSADLSENAGYDAVRSFLSGGGKIDGLFTVTDTLGVGAFHAFKTAGLRIPEDVAVIGVGDSEAARFMDPPLTTIGVSQGRLAEEATKLLLDYFDGRLAKPTSVLVPFEPILRQSTGHGTT